MSKKKCFIVCPISAEGTDIRKRSDQLLNHIIKPVMGDFEFETIRIDKLQHNGSITEEILKFLRDSELVISDITDLNPNCFYEIGYRSALNKPLILLKDKEQDIPFDISDIRTLSYNLSDLDEAEQIKEDLKSTVSNLSFDNLDETSINENISENKTYDLLNKILNSILNLDNKIGSYNSDIISQLTDKLIQNSKPKTENEIMMEFMSNIMSKPQQLKALVELGNSLEEKN